MPEVRTHQAERKFAIDLGTSVGGHGPFRGLDAPLALQTLYHGKTEKTSSSEVQRAIVETQPDISTVT
jgi:hypothetical protein